uniref:Aa_trans domain-containing protein n=2 Tax=Caenorhabditis tropicalis TaxID=1561998 RepID=A0A1I7UZ96_9PELO
MLGFGQLCIMVGYDSESFILESVIHSIHERNPEKVSQYAGYYGQAVIFCAYMTTCLFAPSILHISTPKLLLIFSAISYTLFPMGFLFFNAHFYFFSAVLLGAGTSFFYLGMGSYLSQHSTRETIESNVSISWSVGCCSLILGAGILAGITSFSAQDTPPTVIHNSTEFVEHERRYSNNEIYPLIFIISFFCGISDCCINGARSVICTIVMPQRRAQAFSVTRMYHAAACMTVFFFSPIVPLYIYTLVLPTLSIASTLLFFHVVDNTHVMERKLTEQVNMEKMRKIIEQI